MHNKYITLRWFQSTGDAVVTGDTRVLIHRNAGVIGDVWVTRGTGAWSTGVAEDIRVTGDPRVTVDKRTQWPMETQGH